MTFDLDSRTVDSLSREGSTKWSRFPGTIGMWVAEMDFGIAPEIRDYVINEARKGTFGYLPAGDAERVLGQAAAWFAEHTGWKPEAQHMLLIPEVLAGLRETIKHFTRPGSAVVVPTPAYMPFLTIPKEFGRDVVEVPSPRDADGSWHLDVDAIEHALADGAGLVILCNPWNPTGRCLTRGELERLSQIVEQHGARVFEDAIHAPLTLAGNSHIPYATVNNAAAAHTITAVAASKGWNIPGLKCAQLVFNNAPDWEAFKPYAHAVSEPTSTLGARAAGVAFTQAGAWLDAVRAYLQENADYLTQRIASWDGVRIAPVEGTYIGFIDFSELAKQGRFGELTPAAWIRENAKVSLTDGSLCGRDYGSFARIIFATPRAILSEALDRIERALHKPRA